MHKWICQQQNLINLSKMQQKKSGAEANVHKRVLVREDSVRWTTESVVHPIKKPVHFFTFCTYNSFLLKRLKQCNVLYSIQNGWCGGTRTTWPKAPNHEYQKLQTQKRNYKDFPSANKSQIQTKAFAYMCALDMCVYVCVGVCVWNEKEEKSGWYWRVN